MRITRLVLLLVFSLQSFVQCAQGEHQHIPPPSVGGITFADVIRLSQAGLSDDVIIKQIKIRNQQFDLSTEQLLQLKNANVSDRVIEAMAGATDDQLTSPTVGTLRDSNSPSVAGVHSSKSGLPTQTTTKGCLAVKSVGSHIMRNFILFGTIGAIVSKEQYVVVGSVDYPATVGAKYHGDYLMAVSKEAKVVVLNNFSTPDDMRKACQ
jgi:hypothetical protein